MNITRTRSLALVFLVSVFVFTVSFPAHARSMRSLPKISHHSAYAHIPDITPGEITLEHLGLLQLAAHDFFNVDRETEEDSENGKLDLSTLLDHGDEYIELGGEPRNRENIVLFSVARKYGIRYNQLVSWGLNEKLARKIVVRKYHRDLKLAYFDAFGELMPKPKKGTATMTENLALRTVHDFLPGFVIIGGEEVMIVDRALQGQHMTYQELQAPSAQLDGELDDVFRDIMIFIPPDTILHIDLLERDSSFADQFDTDFSFEHFLEEVSDGSYDHYEDSMRLIRSLFAKGLNI